MAKPKFVLLCILAAASISDAYKILVIFPLPARSHGILGDGVVRHLLNAGHEVTYVTAFPKNISNPKLHEVDVSGSADLFPRDMLNIKTMLDNKAMYSWMKNLIWFKMNTVASNILELESFQELLGDKNQHFDLVIAEWFFNELYSGVASIFNVPLIWVSTIEPHWMILSLIDETLNPAYNGYDVTEKPPFTFLQRVQELWFTVKITFLRKTIGQYLQYRSYIQTIVPHIEARGKVPPAFEDLQYNSSLVFGNSHVSMGGATRLPQNYIPIGGYHIDDEVKPLPDNLKKIIEEAKHGVIYFSMGSNLKSKDMPESLKESLVKMFGTLKETVLWKFEEKYIDLPKNLHILDWAPQQSILGHPNVKLFITHGGLLSTTETIFAGKPIIGIPALTDQFINVARAVSRGFAKKVDLSYTMADELKLAIVEILSDPKYAQKARELSFIHHHRPAKPGAELVHWTEHVIKTQGAPHLRSVALLVPWYQKIYLDLAMLIVLIVYILRFVLKLVKSAFSSKISGSKKTN